MVEVPGQLQGEDRRQYDPEGQQHWHARQKTQFQVLVSIMFDSNNLPF